MATVRCPSCDQALEVLEAYRDWTVRCPHCETEFVPDAVGTEARRPPPRSRPPREEPDDRYGARDERRDRDDDRYDDDDDDDDDDDRYDREEALRIVGPPAMWLEIVSWLSILLAIVLFGLCMLLAVAMDNNNPNGNNDEDALVWIFAGFCTSVLLVPYSVVMAIGARKMRTLSSRGWALAACIMGIGAFVLFGVCGLVQAGVGIWALVTLENPVVRDAFGVGYRRRRRRVRRRRDWDD